MLLCTQPSNYLSPEIKIEMKAAHKKLLAELVTQYRQLSELTASQEKQKDSLKEEINAIANLYRPELVDGIMVVVDATGNEVGTLKETKNKAKVLTITGSSPTKLEMERLLSKLDDRYATRGINVTSLYEDRAESHVQKVLKKLNLQIIQDTRFDIKA